MTPRLWAVPAVLLLVPACASDGTPVTPATESPATPTTAPTSATSSPQPAPERRAGTRVVTAGSDHGPMLYDVSGQAIYLFDKEESARPECYGACAEAWPPVLTDGEPRAAGGTRRRLLGTTERRDGSLQVTYGGHPLYFYAHEGKWQVLCHDVEEYGGVWLVVQPDGDPAP